MGIFSLLGIIDFVLSLDEHKKLSPQGTKRIVLDYSFEQKEKSCYDHSTNIFIDCDLSPLKYYPITQLLLRIHLLIDFPN